MYSVLVPLIKNKNGDLCVVNNSLTKIFKSVFMQHISMHDDSNKYQFDFKAGLSTVHCTNVVKNVFNYYISRGSHVLHVS